jgi:hypothetical protein
MKKIPALFFVLGVIACSSEDGNPIVEKELLIEAMSDTETEDYYQFFYNPDSSLQRIEGYQDGALRELQIGYRHGTRVIDEIITTVEEWEHVGVLKFTYNISDLVDSANFYSSDEPGLKVAGLTYTYDDEGQLENIRYWNMFGDQYDYLLEIHNNNITAYDDEVFEYKIELEYSSILNPLYPFGLYLHAAEFSYFDPNFEEYLSLNRSEKVFYKQGSEITTEKITLKSNRNNYPTQEKHIILDTVQNNFLFTYYE